jgi:hypothetical protein
MGTPVGYRLRRSRLSAHRLGSAFLIMAIYIALLALVNLPSRSSTGPVGIVIALSCVALTAAALWPVRALDVTPQALWVRERLVPVESRFGGTSGRLRKIDWPDVVEVLLAPSRGRVTMVAGFRSYTSLHAMVADLPVRDAREVAEAISRVAPGTVVRSEGRRSEILIHTGRPYVAEPRSHRAQVLATLLCVLGSGLIAFVMVRSGYGEYAAAQVAFWLTGLAVWLSGSPVFVSPERVAVRSWGVSRTVPWANIASVRLTATGDTGELAVRVAGSPGGRPRPQRLPRGTDLAEIDAIIRAYAPPHALRHGRPEE